MKDLELSQPDPIREKRIGEELSISKTSNGLSVKPMKFVSLHTHSTFSYGDGYGPVKEHVQRVAELGMGALALTEHGNLSSHAQLEKACNEIGIKPIFGCELYVAPPGENRKCHQTVLAMNEVGLQNLNRIVTKSWKNFYRWPTTSWKMLEEHNEGLIVLSGCADSVLSCTLLGGKSYGDKRLTASKRDIARAAGLIGRYQEVFGDRYYLEAQRFPGLDRTCALNPLLARLSELTGARLVGTADVHYPRGSDNEMQKILHAAHRGSTVEATEASWEYDILLTYPESDREIYMDLVGTGLTKAQAREAVLESGRIAERCNVILPKNQPIRFPKPTKEIDGTQVPMSANELIRKWLNEGWHFRMATNPNMRKNRQAYKARVEHELGMMEEKDFLDYFLVLSDAVRWAKDHKIPVGPARGSAAASLVCYLLRITEVDPMLFPHMLFERFIDPTRTELPDVDLDFSDDRRIEVKRYLEEKYGADRVGNIGNFTRYRGKNSIDDVARVYNIPVWETEVVKNLIIERSGGDSRISDSLEDTFNMFPKAAAVLERHPELANAIRLEGNYRGMGVHAAGIVISNTPITDTCAVYERESAGKTTQVIAYDKKDGEYVGMLKADFLGLSTMGMIGIALDMIGMDLEDLYRIPLDDQKVLEAFRRGDVTGIFQFEGRATRIVCSDVVPDHFQHLADINALSRPGPLFSGMTAAYCEVKHGRKTPERYHPILDNLTDWTYGQVVYQEQVLSTIRELGGFPMSEVHSIRKIISQKLGEAQFEAKYKMFEDNACQNHGCTPEQAQKIWRFLATSATYSFNIAHCISYSMLAYWQMWIKQHHPTAFYAAQLRKVNDEKLYKLMRDAVRHNISILPPSINESMASWSAPMEGVVRAGFLQIPGVGPKTSEVIVEWRNQKIRKGQKAIAASAPDLMWSDLLEVKGIGPKSIEKIVAFCEAEDPFGLNRVQDLFKSLRRIIKPGNGYGVPAPTHNSESIPRTGDHDGIVWMGIPKAKNYQDYIENQRSRYGKEEAEILAEMKDPHLVKSCVVQCFDDYDDDVYCRWNRWQFPKFEKMLESLAVDGSNVLIVRGRKREDFGVSLHVTDAWVLELDEDERL
ncbi:DnaE-like DNA polymerase III alpha [Mycobacterium phage Benzema]|nr:DnaE-like DNA polymerase III alpha [Mycobacterium phage Benzema]